MANPNPETDLSMFDKSAEKPKSPTVTPTLARRISVKPPSSEITIKDFFDFMKIAYQVYEHLEGGEDSGKIDWEELTKLTVVYHGIDKQEKELVQMTASAEPRAILSKSDTTIATTFDIGCGDGRRGSLYRRRSLRSTRVDMQDFWSEANLKSKLNDTAKESEKVREVDARKQVINEGILDSIMPYIAGHRKPTKTSSAHQPIIKNSPSSSATEVKKPASYGGLVDERPSKDRLGRRKSSLAVDKSNQRQDGDVEIHVCDEVKGLKKDFRCPQKLLVTKMGYFADVTSGQKLEDMDISVHCDIQIFDWLMRWVKRDSILVGDWPRLDPSNVIPILVSASFLQMEPLLHDCLSYCHTHMNEIVKTSTNLACLSDTLLTRLAAMYTNSELEGVKDRKDKIHSRLYCKMILSLAEPVPETLRGHYATLATLFKCSRCNKLLGRDIAENVPCQPINMRISQRGHVLSSHTKDPSWNLSDYIVWLHGELRSWRRVYWRLWGDCHFLKCLACDSYFPAYQMEWCCHHAEGPQFFTLDGRPPLPIGRYPCCGERAYRFELVTRNTGCQFREHTPEEVSARDAAVMAIYRQFRETIVMRPPQLMFPERLTRLVAREPGDDSSRLPGKEVFWWEGIQLVPPRQPLGLLGKLYTGNTKFNQSAFRSIVDNNECTINVASTEACISDSTAYARFPALATPGSAAALAVAPTNAFTVANASPDINIGILRLTRNSANPTVVQDTEPLPPPPVQKKLRGPVSGKKGAAPTEAGEGESSSDGESSDTSESSDSETSGSAASEEDAPTRLRRPPPLPAVKATPNKRRVRGGGCGRQWMASLSARSNQDGQRRFEERVLRQMRQALTRRGALSDPLPVPVVRHHRAPPGGVYVKLEADWREAHCPQQTRAQRPVYSARQQRKAYK